MKPYRMSTLLWFPCTTHAPLYSCITCVCMSFTGCMTCSNGSDVWHTVYKDSQTCCHCTSVCTNILIVVIERLSRPRPSQSQTASRHHLQAQKVSCSGVLLYPLLLKSLRQVHSDA